MTPPAQRVECTAWRSGAEQPGDRLIPEETPVALVHDGSTTAVLMATPADLEDLAYGFTLTEGLAQGASASQILDVEIVEGHLGIEARVWLESASRIALLHRRRRMTGPTGCGLCGLDSLAAAVSAPPPVMDELRLGSAEVQLALASLPPAQSLGHATRGVHAAGWWTPAAGLVAVREDVGRHNALDKLAGALMRREQLGGGILLLTSRVSVEMVQKAAVMGAEVVIAISVPTALAIRTADAAGLSLVAVARHDGFEIFTHPHRIAAGTCGAEGLSLNLKSSAAGPWLRD